MGFLSFCAKEYILKKLLPGSVSWSFPPCDLIVVSIVTALIFKSLIYFELTFLYIEIRVQLHLDVHFFQQYLLKRLPILGTFVKNKLTINMWI